MRVADLVCRLLDFDQDAEVVLYEPDVHEYLPIKAVHLDEAEPDWGRPNAEVYFSTVEPRPE